MKVLNAIAVALACLCLPAISFAQIDKKVKIEFTDNGTNADVSLKRQLREVYTALPIGYQVSIPLVEVREIHRDYGTAARISKLRCQAIEEYYKGMGLQSHQMIIQTYNWPWPSTAYESGEEECYEARAIYEFQVIREPDLPLQFTHSVTDPMDYGCDYQHLDNRWQQLIVHSSGAKLIIPPRAFLARDGRPIDYGNIDLRFCAYLNKSDFLKADITSNNGKRMLVSGGMVRITAWYGDRELELKRGESIQVILHSDGPADRGMSAFYGQEEYGITNWVPNSRSQTEFMDQETLDALEEELEEMEMEYESTIEEEMWISDTEYWEADTNFEADLQSGQMMVEAFYNRSDGYILSVNKLGWINCDRFYEIENPVNLMVQVPEYWDSVSVRLVFKSINSVLPGSFANRNGLIKFENIPAGEEVSLVAFGMKSDKVLWDQQQIILGRQEHTNLAFEEISKVDFLANIEALGD